DPARPRQGKRCAVLGTGADIIGTVWAAGPGKVAQGFVHHFADGVAPHRALAIADGAVGNPAAVGVVFSTAIELDGFEAVDGGNYAVVLDIAAVIDKAAVVRVYFLGEAGHVAAQGAACGVLGVGAGKQAEVHPIGFAEVVEDADGFAVAVRIGL